MSIRYITHSVFFFFIFLCVPFAYTYGADGQSLSVTPPLFQLSILPGSVWQSSIKVVNTNPYPLTIYAELVNFEAMGEQGQGRFVPVFENQNATLAEWIEVGKGPFTIPREQSFDVPFFVDIPKDASPGGHYAAILISTEPPKSEDALSVQTSQAVTSLFFVRIEGDVEELGTIREFRALDAFVPTPDIELSLRFENKGNVHLQPRGDIVISNMWGTERGGIPVNYQTHFGNVLPQSIRDFSFAWKSEFKITDIGRYKAEATLAYGDNGVKSVNSVTYFWVVPLKGTLITLAVLIAFIVSIVFIVRAYVRRMLTLAGVEVEEGPVTIQERLYQRSKTAVVSAPIREGVLDLRNHLKKAKDPAFTTYVRFILHYKKFFISLVVLIGIFVSVYIYIQKATREGAEYEVRVIEPDTVLDFEEKSL